MHHRRKRTTRREGKRIDRKKLRGAEREAMNGRAPDTVALPWSQGVLNREVPLVNDVMPHRAPSRQRNPKKTRCPYGGAHKWVRSESETKEFFRNYVAGHCANCEDDLKVRKRMNAYYVEWGEPERVFNLWPIQRSMMDGCRHHGEKVWYTVKVVTASCQKCRTTKTVSRGSDAWEQRHPKVRRNTIPKREVTLY